jgi:hypothetical protein
MFTKNKVSQSMIDAVNKVLGEQPVEQEDVLLNEAGAPIKEPTSTGMRVYGRSYGNSAKAKQDQSKSSVDDLKGPKTKDLMQKDKEEHEKTKGKYDEAAKPDFLDFDKDGDKKEPMKSALAAKKKVAEELKGDQHKIDANKNNKVDAHDFAILRSKKKVKEGREFTEKLLETVRKSDVPAYLRKAKGDTPLTMADVKAPKKDTISDPKNLAKASHGFTKDQLRIKKEIAADRLEQKMKNQMKKEEFEQIDEVSLKTATSAYVKRMGDDGPNEKSSQDKAIKTMDYIAKKHGVKGVARATKTADDKYGLNDPVHNPRKAFVKQVMAGVKKEEVELDEAVMTHIALGKKVKNSEGGYDQTVHHKGEHIGNIHSYAHLDYETGKKTGRTKYATSDKHGGLMTVGHITPDEGVDELRWVHAQNKKTQKEEVEQIDEKDPCWDNYTQVGMKKKNGREVPNCVPSKGVPAAKGYKEEVELEERTMTSADKTERERIVKGMKKGLAGFKSRYGKDAKSVMYATATKQAMKEAAVDSAPITTDTLAGRMPGGKSNDFKSYKLRVRPLDKEGETIPKDATPEIIQPDETPARKSHEVKEATIAGTSGWKKMAATVTDKSGAKHSPMSRARNLAQQAFKKVQDKTKVKSEMMLGKDGGTSESKKW